MAIGCFICVNINLVIVLIDISNFVISGGILFKMLILGINEMVSCLSPAVLKGYSLFLIYKTNIFVKLVKLSLMPMWLYFFVIHFCCIWAFSSSRKHLLITLLRLEFVVVVLCFSIYFYLCKFNYSLFFVVYFLVSCVCEGSLGLSILVSIIRSHDNDYFQSYSALHCQGFFVFWFFLTPLCFFLGLGDWFVHHYFFISFVYFLSLSLSLSLFWGGLGYIFGCDLISYGLLMVLSFLVCEFVFL